MNDEINLGYSYLPFHLSSYWDNFFRNQNLNISFDWYFNLEFYKSNTFNILNWDRNSEIIILGVGNSNIIEYLIKNKFIHVTVVDFSSTLISFLKIKYENLKECAEWDCKLKSN